MNFVADESIDGPIVQELRSQGHQVASIAEIRPAVVTSALQEHRTELPHAFTVVSAGPVRIRRPLA